MKKMRKDLERIDDLRKRFEDVNAQIKEVWPNVNPPFNSESFHRLSVERMNVTSSVGHVAKKQHK